MSVFFSPSPFPELLPEKFSLRKRVSVRQHHGASTGNMYGGRGSIDKNKNRFFFFWGKTHAIGEESATKENEEKKKGRRRGCCSGGEQSKGTDTQMQSQRKILLDRTRGTTNGQVGREREEVSGGKGEICMRKK